LLPFEATPSLVRWSQSPSQTHWALRPPDVVVSLHFDPNKQTIWEHDLDVVREMDSVCRCERREGREGQTINAPLSDGDEIAGMQLKKRE
jgi:hypothetical protein